MGNYKKPSSSPEWKVLVDEEADRYLHQSFFKKLEEEENKDKKYANSWSQPDTVKIINTSRATFYGERKHKDETEIALSKSMQEVMEAELSYEEYRNRTMELEAELSDEEYVNKIMELVRRREAIDAADRETQEEKRNLKAQEKINHRKPSLPPEWKVLPGSPGNESKHSRS